MICPLQSVGVSGVGFGNCLQPITKALTLGKLMKTLEVPRCKTNQLLSHIYVEKEKPAAKNTSSHNTPTAFTQS